MVEKISMRNLDINFENDFEYGEYVDNPSDQQKQTRHADIGVSVSFGPV